MKLPLLYTVTTLLVGSINAAILSETQHITNGLDRQIAEPYKSRDVKGGLNAAAEYFKGPKVSKQNLKSKTKENFAAAAEYFKAPDTNELRSDALILAQERLAGAAEYLKAPEFPKRISRNEVKDARAAAAEYFKAPESPRHNNRDIRTAESSAAAAEYFRAPEYHFKVNHSKKNLAAVRRQMFRPTTKAPRLRFIRLGLV